MPKAKDIPDTESKANFSEREIVREKENEFTAISGQKSDDPIQGILDEGTPVGHPGGQLRGDQTEGHRGGSRRQTLNRGRD